MAICSRWRRFGDLCAFTLAARLAVQGLSAVLSVRDEAFGEAAASALWARVLRSARFRRLAVTDQSSVAAPALGVHDVLAAAVLVAGSGCAWVEQVEEEGAWREAPSSGFRRVGALAYAYAYAYGLPGVYICVCARYVYL